MNRQRSTKIKISACSGFLTGLLALTGALSANATEIAGTTVPCAILQSASGEAEILDSSRTHLSEVAPKSPIPCGGWVSVGQGNVVLKHRFGYDIRLGPHTFAQFLDSDDAILLFRGQLYGQAGGGMGELRVLTPNARLKVSRGAIVALFDTEEESTQLTAIEGKSEIGNRFDSHASVSVNAAESSSLDFKLLRVTPSVPKLVSSASLKEKLQALNVPARSVEKALAVIRNRAKKVFVSRDEAKKIHDNITDEAKPGPTVVSRKIAGKRSPASDGFDPQAYLEGKTVGGSADGLAILNQSGHSGKKGKKARMEDPEAQLIRKQRNDEDTEKQRLIEELSQIKSD